MHTQLLLGLFLSLVLFLLLPTLLPSLAHIKIHKGFPGTLIAIGYSLPLNVISGRYMSRSM